MLRGMSWLRPRGHPGGLSTGVSAVGGLILFVTALTGGIGAVQVARVHAALAQAAQAAVQSEQQTGCWTDATTQSVYHTLKGAGLNPGTVAITADTGQSTTYGGAVTAGFRTAVHVSVLGAPLITVPVAAAANAVSFYTPAASGGSNPACVTPATCPTVTTLVQHCTPAHQRCAPVTTQQCTPVTRQVCGPVSSQQCGWTSQPQYTCTPTQSCHAVTTESCSTQYYWDTQLNCYTNWTYLPGYGWDAQRACNGGWASHQVCSPTTKTVCSTTESCGWHNVSTYSCHTVTTTQCQTQTTQSCHAVTTTQCTTVPAQCTTVPETTRACG